MPTMGNGLGGCGEKEIGSGSMSREGGGIPSVAGAATFGILFGTGSFFRAMAFLCCAKHALNIANPLVKKGPPGKEPESNAPGFQ